MSPARVVLVSALVGLLARPAGADPAVTVYTRDLGFVRETRTLELSGSPDTLRLPEVGERIDFTSVRLVPRGAPRVTRLAYRFDAASGDALIDRAIGSRLRVASRGDRLTEGTLVASDGSWLVVRTDDGGLSTLSRAAVEEVRLAKPPGDLLLRPTLEAVVEGGRVGRHEAELSYLTGGLSWSAEHTLVRAGEGSGTWSAAVTVENSCGRDFERATLKLVAGEPGKAGVPAPVPMMRAMSMEMAGAAEAPDLAEASFAEYHLYTLGRPATLRNRESQTLTMLEPRTVKLAPRYLYRGGGTAVRVQVLLENTDASGLGVPLPAGRVRFYESDPAGALQFTGETRIPHTAAGEKLTLDVGNAFDLAAERREVYNRRIADREREYQVEVKLRNRKARPVEILVEESAAGDYEIVKSSHLPTRKDARTIQFTLPVAPDRETVLSYTVRSRY